jgi:heme A synthase
MMSFTTWAHRVLSPATLYSVIGLVLCRCVTRPATVADRRPTTLTPGCSNCDGSLQPACHTSRLYSMSHLLHALRACGAALVM